MGKSAAIANQVEDPAVAQRHCLIDLPYRSVVFHSVNQHKVPLFVVAGSNASPSSAIKALRTAIGVHGGKCFYCGTSEGEMTVDHVEPLGKGGDHAIQNLVVSCQPCNRAKAAKPIELFNVAAGRDWLEALLRQTEQRLAGLTQPLPPQPKPGATTGP
jgi:5-methylcytosine-specific restriction endonuclease McrA